jgi:tetratricopeptide (TPR) repeat protein
VVRELAGADAANGLGELAISIGKLDTAEALFRTAIARNPEHSRALAGLGDIHKFRDQQVEAEPYFLRAIEKEPDEPLNHLDYAEYLHEMARKESSTSDTAPKLYEQARAHYVKAWKLDPKAPEVYLM